MNPTDARSNTIAAAASCRLAVSKSSVASSSVPASTGSSRGSRNAPPRATANSTAPYTNVADEPMVSCNAPAGNTATVPATPAITPSFEFASTSSVSVRTTAGTNADFDTVYVFWSTNARNTSGNRARLLANGIIANCTTTRDPATICTMSRRPPLTRSIVGPIAGATSRNGAKLTSKKASTFDRAPDGSTSKKNESASATTIAASPPIMAAWVNASRWNFEVGAGTLRS